MGFLSKRNRKFTAAEREAGVRQLTQDWAAAAIAVVDDADSSSNTKPVWRACAVGASVAVEELGFRPDSVLARWRDEFFGPAGAEVARRCHLAIAEMAAQGMGENAGAFSADLVIALQVKGTESAVLRMFREKAVAPESGDPSILLARWVAGPVVAPGTVDDVSDLAMIRLCLSNGYRGAMAVLDSGSSEIHY